MVGVDLGEQRGERHADDDDGGEHLRDVGEMWGRCRGDAGEMQGRCRGGVGLTLATSTGRTPSCSASLKTTKANSPPPAMSRATRALCASESDEPGRGQG